MNFIATFLTVLLFIFLVLWFATFMTNVSKYKYYKPTYLAIKNRVYINTIRDNDEMRFVKDDDENHFSYNDIRLDSDRSLKLIEGGYIFLTVGFDPYSIYWFYKIKNEMKWQTMTLAEQRDYKLNQILK